jgi:3-dehydroquinate synthase
MPEQIMRVKKFHFSTKTISCYFNAAFQNLETLVDKTNAVIITDENIFSKQAARFDGWKTIILKAGEQHKNQQTVDDVIAQLIAMNADRQTFIIGVGGGVVTDLAGFVASIYMRGVRFAFVPSSILAMVDASIGGKNGIDVGVYKNLVGVINQPEFLLYDYSLLQTLPYEEWINGFAEIIKHACIKDKDMFDLLANTSLETYHQNLQLAGNLIERNVEIKYKVVSEDENETGERKLLNFGHTIGHAIENTCQLPHGSAISIGMVAACAISEKINHFAADESAKVKALLSAYQLPVDLRFDKETTWNILLHDKKKSGTEMSFVVLDAIGKGSLKKIPLTQLYHLFNSLT